MIPPLYASVTSNSSKEKGSSSCSSTGCPPIRPSASILCRPILASLRSSSNVCMPWYLTTSAGTTYSPSLSMAGTSSLTSSAILPEGTSLPLTGSRSTPSSASTPPSFINAKFICFSSLSFSGLSIIHHVP